MLKLGLISATIKEALAEDTTGVLQHLYSLGLQGVEKPEDYPVGTKGIPERIAVPVSWDDIPGGYAHLKENKPWSPDSLDTTIPQLVARAREVSAPYAVQYWGPADDADQVMRQAAMLDTVGKRLAAEGITFCYHNHDHEFKPLPGSDDGARAIDLLLANSDPQHLGFEFDLGWVRVGGEDPAQFLRQHPGRAPLVHVRDVEHLETRGAFTLPGLGILDIPEILSACKEVGTEWVILEPNKTELLTPMEFITASILNMRMMGIGGN